MRIGSLNKNSPRSSRIVPGMANPMISPAAELRPADKNLARPNKSNTAPRANSTPPITRLAVLEYLRAR